jgi:hypothetical protein
LANGNGQNEEEAVANAKAKGGRCAGGDHNYASLKDLIIITGFCLGSHDKKRKCLHHLRADFVPESHFHDISMLLDFFRTTFFYERWVIRWN